MMKRYDLVYRNLQGDNVKIRRLDDKRAYETEHGEEISQAMLIKKYVFVRRLKLDGMTSKLEYITTPNGFRVRKEK